MLFYTTILQRHICTELPAGTKQAAPSMLSTSQQLRPRQQQSWACPGVCHTLLRPSLLALALDTAAADPSNDAHGQSTSGANLFLARVMVTPRHEYGEVNEAFEAVLEDAGFRAALCRALHSRLLPMQLKAKTLLTRSLRGLPGIQEGRVAESDGSCAHPLPKLLGYDGMGAALAASCATLTQLSREHAARTGIFNRQEAGLTVMVTTARTCLLQAISLAASSRGAGLVQWPQELMTAHVELLQQVSSCMLSVPCCLHTHLH